MYHTSSDFMYHTSSHFMFNFWNSSRDAHRSNDPTTLNNNKVTTTTNYLYRIIQTILCFCLNDRTICEELSRHFNRYCLQIIYYIPTSSDDNDKNYDDDDNDDDDPIYEIQDLIGELISIFTMHSIEFPCSECSSSVYNWWITIAIIIMITIYNDNNE